MVRWIRSDNGRGTVVRCHHSLWITYVSLDLTSFARSLYDGRLACERRGVLIMAKRAMIPFVLETALHGVHSSLSFST
jgi:hypothetical protein